MLGSGPSISPEKTGCITVLVVVSLPWLLLVEVNIVVRILVFGVISVLEDTNDGFGGVELEESGGLPGMSPPTLSLTYQGPRSQVSPAAILLPQNERWW